MIGAKQHLTYFLVEKRYKKLKIGTTEINGNALKTQPNVRMLGSS